MSSHHFDNLDIANYGHLGARELAFISAVKFAVGDIVDWHDGRLSEGEIQDFTNNLISMVINKEPPSNYFNHIDSGAYKECYEGLGDWIVKFASTSNATSAERQLLEAANQSGIGFMFLPTKFIEMPAHLPVTYIERGESGIYDCCGCEHNCSNNSSCPAAADKNGPSVALSTIILQPRAITADDSSCDEFPYRAEEYLKKPIYYESNKVMSYKKAMNSHVASRDWLQDVVDLYGKETFHLFNKFVEDFAISDLHLKNIGYLSTPKGYIPVILDWLSYELD